MKNTHTLILRNSIDSYIEDFKKTEIDDLDIEEQRDLLGHAFKSLAEKWGDDVYDDLIYQDKGVLLSLLGSYLICDDPSAKAVQIVELMINRLKEMGNREIIRVFDDRGDYLTSSYYLQNKEV